MCDLDQGHAASARAAAIVPAAGALPRCRSYCSLRQSAPDAVCAGRSNKFGTVALYAFSGWTLVWACAHWLCSRHWYAAGGADSHWLRVGTFEAPTFTSGLPPPALLLPTRLASYAWHRCIVATFAGGQGNFDMALRFDSTEPCEHAQLSLIGLGEDGSGI